MSYRFLSLPVLLVFSVIVYIYYTTVFIVIGEWLGLNTSPGLLNATIFTVFAFMSVICYAIAIVKDPGYVPASFMPDIEDSENPIHEIKRKGGDLRYCQKCSLYKPPRAHHCRVCKRCVLRMDHHCVWISNCVGHANYKIFLIFLLYSVIACIHSLVMVLSCVAYDFNKDQQQSGGSFRTSNIVCGIILIPLTIALSVLLGWHVYLIKQNKTTIEHHEGVRAMWLAEKVGHSYRHPYDIGLYGNLVSVLGPNIFSWTCPTPARIGSGLRFRTTYDIISAGPS